MNISEESLVICILDLVRHDWFGQNLCLSLNNRLLCSCFFLSCRLFRVRCFVEEGNVTSLPIRNDRAANVIDIRFSTFEKLSSSLSDLTDEVFCVLPMVYSEDVGDILLVHTIKDGLNVTLWIRNTLSTDHSLQNLVGLRLTRIVDDTWAVDKVNALRQSDVLPNLGLAGNGGDFAASLFHQSVDDAAFTHVRVPNQANRNVFLVLVEHIELL